MLHQYTDALAMGAACRLCCTPAMAYTRFRPSSACYLRRPVDSSRPTSDKLLMRGLQRPHELVLAGPLGASQGILGLGHLVHDTVDCFQDLVRREGLYG